MMFVGYQLCYRFSINVISLNKSIWPYIYFFLAGPVLIFFSETHRSGNEDDPGSNHFLIHFRSGHYLRLYEFAMIKLRYVLYMVNCE